MIGVESKSGLAIIKYFAPALMALLKALVSLNPN